MKNPFDTEERLAFRESVRRLIEKEITPYADAWDEQGAIPWSLHQTVGAIGVFGSGVIADKLGKTDKRWYMWVAVSACVISIPLQISTFWVDDPYKALMCMTIPSILANAYLGATIASVHSMVGLKTVSYTHLTLPTIYSV